MTFVGGTHNHGGPPWHFLEAVFLPAIRRMGAAVAAELRRYGFAPAGGGRWTAIVQPSELRPLTIMERGELRSLEVDALVSNLPETIAEREIGVIRAGLGGDARYRSSTVESDGPGNIVMITGRFANSAELATGFGQRGVPAEHVAGVALRCWQQYEQSGAPVGEHLADQLLLPIALARKGAFVTTKPSLHATTNATVISEFLPVRFRMEATTASTYLISAG